MASTQKLYWEDSALRAFEATVLTCRPQGAHFLVTLDATAFYPEGGGQPADHGTLGGAAVLDVHERDGAVLHTIDAALDPGTRVAGLVDGARRMDLMQQHSGEHVVSGIVHRLFGYDNIGFHLSENAVTLTFNGVLEPAQLQQVEQLANEAVWRNAPTEVLTPTTAELAKLCYRSKLDLQEGVRIVRVAGEDTCACCGTHVAHAGEIGLIKLTAAERYGAGTRVWMVAGGRALEDYRQRFSETERISTQLSVKPWEAAAGVERLQGQVFRLQGQLAQAQEALFAARAAALAEVQGPLCVFEPNLSPDAVRRFALLLSESRPHPCAVFSGGDAPQTRYAIAASAPGIDLRPHAKPFNALAAGRGGGSRQLLQGSANAAPAQLEAAFFSIFNLLDCD